MDYARIRFSSCWHSSAVVRPMISAGWQEKCAVGVYIPLFLTESKWWGICEMEFVYKLSNFWSPEMWAKLRKPQNERIVF